MVELGVNIDHVATLREARKGRAPDIIMAAKVCELAGAHQITVHLRQDRRHIQDRDVRLLRETVSTFLNLEMAATEEMTEIAREVRPDAVCLVPEKRQELTTEGGLDVRDNFDRISAACARLEEAGILVSLFIEPDLAQIEAASRSGATFVEIHTGRYAEAQDADERQRQLLTIREAARAAQALGLRVNAGHGLNYHNVAPIAAIPELEELNIGHAIICRAVLVGLDAAVREMKGLIIAASAR